MLSVLIETSDYDLIANSEFIMQTITQFSKKSFNIRNINSVDSHMQPESNFSI